MRKFLQQATLARNPVKGTGLRELPTRAQACNHLLSGRLKENLETLLQRYKRGEAQATQQLLGAVTENLKITDVNKHSSLSLAEHELVAEPTSEWSRPTWLPRASPSTTSLAG